MTDREDLRARWEEIHAEHLTAADAFIDGLAGTPREFLAAAGARRAEMDALEFAIREEDDRLAAEERRRSEAFREAEADHRHRLEEARRAEYAANEAHRAAMEAERRAQTALLRYQAAALDVGAVLGPAAPVDAMARLESEIIAEKRRRMVAGIVDRATGVAEDRRRDALALARTRKAELDALRGDLRGGRVRP